ncbi:MAG: LysM peptidoglycan-binding domain-containing protein [Balneolaceae bacterium]|nr:LysM peptidoglycan-binding domain-containing protein [Balneolaceae bacterium]
MNMKDHIFPLLALVLFAVHPATSVAQDSTQTVREGEGLTHTVQAQETLFSISKQYGVSIAEIKRWNSLDSNSLDIGQQLTLYRGDTAGTQEEGDLVVSGSTQQNTYYTVRSGDSLYKIAREHNMTVEELQTLNDLQGSTIRVGQQLTVRETDAPPSVRSGSEDSSPQGAFLTYRPEEDTSLDALLERFRMDEKEFHLLNPDLSGNRLLAGQRLTVLAPPTRNYRNPYLVNANMRSLGTTSVTRYSDSERGATTTSGELYTPGELTGGHPNITLGSVIYVENPDSGRSVLIRVNDRVNGEELKLSRAAWEALEIRAANPSVTIYQDQ